MSLSNLWWNLQLCPVILLPNVRPNLQPCLVMLILGQSWNQLLLPSSPWRNPQLHLWIRVSLKMITPKLSFETPFAKLLLTYHWLNSRRLRREMMWLTLYRKLHSSCDITTRSLYRWLPVSHLVAVPALVLLGTSVTTPAPTTTTTEAPLTNDTDFSGCEVDGRNFFGEGVSREQKGGRSWRKCGNVFMARYSLLFYETRSNEIRIALPALVASVVD